MNETQRIRLGLVAARGVGPRIARRVRDACGGWSAAVQAARSDGGAVPERWREGFARAPDRAVEVERACHRAGVRVLFRGEADWPARLRGLSDEPEVLFTRGDVRLLGERGVAIVGTREASRFGTDLAFDVARRIAGEGWSVVSGLARGIDTAAHRGALAGEGDTVAVLGCGPDVPYPPENLALLERIAVEGVVVSEFSPGVEPRSGHFPRRNRILAALADAVLVVESRVRGGAMITVRHALDLGKDVYVVPGRPGSPLSEGPLVLLREGARPVRGADDLLEDLAGVGGGPPPAHAEVRALDAVREGARTPEDLARELGVTPSEARDSLARLELLGHLPPGESLRG